MKNAGCGAFYGMGLIGSLIFYLQHATNLLMGVVGFFKAIFWPAVVVYKAFELLGL